MQSISLNNQEVLARTQIRLIHKIQKLNMNNLISLKDLLLMKMFEKTLNITKTQEEIIYQGLIMLANI